MPKKNDVLPLTIESIGLNGEGIAHLEGQVVFVSGGLPGEVCEVQLLKVGRSAIWGKALRGPLPLPGPGDARLPLLPQVRRLPVPPHALLRRAGGQAPAGGGRAPPDRWARPPRFCDFGRKKYGPAVIGIRCSSPFSPGPAGPKIGFFRARSATDVVDMADCLLQPETASALAQALREWMGTLSGPGLEERAHPGPFAAPLPPVFPDRGPLLPGGQRGGPPP